MARLLCYKQLLTSANVIDTQGIIGQSYGKNAEQVKFIVRFNVGTSAGTIVFEEADSENYQGVWSPLGQVAWTVASSEKATTINGLGGFRAIRARISVTVAGGTADCWCQVQG